ncbi:MAG: hypothetical protein ACYC9Q_09980 [Bacillota bacterium]
MGKVGTGQYYCWDCFIEFTVGKGRPHLYRIDREGTLVAFNPDHGTSSGPAPGAPPGSVEGDEARPF